MEGKKNILSFKTLLIVALIVITLVVGIVWLIGLSRHHSILHNSLISVTILWFVFFVFMFLCLYGGVRLHDNFKHSKDDLGFNRPGRISVQSIEYFIQGWDGIEGIIIGILLWIFIAVILASLLYLFGAIIWVAVLVLGTFMYWVFCRTVHIILNTSQTCAGRPLRSLAYALAYSVLYFGWIYGIILISKT